MGPFRISKPAYSLCILLVLMGTLFFGIQSSEVSARPHRLGVIPDKGSHFGCGTCHLNAAGGGPKNAFGNDYEKMALPAGDKYTEKLGSKDSDGDGATNDQEFKAGTHPGDPKSKPAKK